MMTNERTRVDGLTVEEYLYAPPRFEAPWLWTPRPPFRGQAHHETQHPALASAVNFDTFDEAMSTFCEAMIPPRVGMYAYVMDESFQVVFGYSASTFLLTRAKAPGWYGVRAAFEWMENSGRFDMMDLAVWEATAMRLAT